MAKATFPNNPTWEEKCRKAWEENARLEAERLANAKQIHDLNIRLGINDTNAARIEDMKDCAVRQQSSYREHVAKLQSRLDRAESIAEERAKELQALRATEPAASALPETTPDVDTAEPDYDEAEDDAVEDALTEAVRAVKAVRREWRDR